ALRDRPEVVDRVGLARARGAGPRRPAGEDLPDVQRAIHPQDEAWRLLWQEGQVRGEECSAKQEDEHEQEEDQENQVMTNGRRGHGEGSVRRRQDGRWEARIRLPDGRRVSAYGETRSEAVRELDRLRQRVAFGQPVQSASLDTCAFLDEWVE